MDASRKARLRYTELNAATYAGTHSGSPEYETFAALGAGTGIINTEAVIKANELCNMLDLDTISTGVVIQRAMESYERGALTKEDADGLNLTFGSANALVNLIPKIAYREGKIGNLLAEGVKRAAENVGRGSWRWAICNTKGLEQSYVETKSSKAYALAFAVNPRGPDHLHTECLAEEGSDQWSARVDQKNYGGREMGNPIHYRL